MLIIDFHVHSSISKDSNLPPKIIPKLMEKLGYNSVCIADHNSNKGAFIAKKYASKNFLVLIGQEIKTPQGEIIVAGSEKEIKGDIQEIIDMAKQENFLTILPHPFDYFRKSSATRRLNKKDFKKLFKKVDAIEAFNSRCFLNISNYYAKLFANFFKKPIVAGSDAHTLSELGKAKTFVDAELSRDEIFEAVKKGKTRIYSKKSFLAVHAKSFFIRSEKIFSAKMKVLKEWKQ